MHSLLMSHFDLTSLSCLTIGSDMHETLCNSAHYHQNHVQKGGLVGMTIILVPKILFAEVEPKISKEMLA